MHRWLPALLMFFAPAAVETLDSMTVKSIAAASHNAVLSGDVDNLQNPLSDLDKFARHHRAAKISGDDLDGIVPDSRGRMRLMRAEDPYEESHPISETGRIEEQKLKEEKDWLEAQKAQIAQEKERIDNEVNRIAIQRMKLEKKRRERNGESQDVSEIAKKVAESVTRRRHTGPVFEGHHQHLSPEQADVQRTLAGIAQSQKEEASENPSALAAESEGHAPAPAVETARQAQMEESLKRFQQELKDAGEQVPDITPDYAAKLSEPTQVQINLQKMAKTEEENKVKENQTKTGKAERTRARRKAPKRKTNQRQASRKKEEKKGATADDENNKVFVNETAKIRGHSSTARSVMSVGANAEDSATNGAKLKANAAQQEAMAHQAAQAKKQQELEDEHKAYQQELEDEHKETSLTRALRELYKTLGEQEGQKAQQPNDMLKSQIGESLGFCIWNVQVARSKNGNSVMKTMQIKGGSNESFFFDGCAHEGPEAQACTNTDQAAEGVRVLKNGQQEIVGYGSCCKDGLTDKIMQVSKGVCSLGPPPPPAYTGEKLATAAVTSTFPQTHHKSTTAVHARGAHRKSTTARPTEGPMDDLATNAQKETTDSMSNAPLKMTSYEVTSSSSATGNQASGGSYKQASGVNANTEFPQEANAATVTAGKEQAAEAGNGTAAIKSTLAGNGAGAVAGSSTKTIEGSKGATAAPADQPSQGADPLPKRIEATTTLCLAGIIVIAAIVNSVFLMVWHLKVGSRLTGGLDTLHATSATFIGVLWTLPIFALLGLSSMVLPELAPLWQFLEVLLLATTFRKMPDLFVQAVGGHIQLQLRSQGNTGSGAESSDADNAAPEPVPAVRGGRLDVFTQFPFCCLRSYVPARPPHFPDLRLLQWSVVLLGIVLPCLSFAEMLFGLEDEEKRAEFQRRLLADEQLPDSLKRVQAAMGSSITQASAFWQHPWVSLVLRLLQALSIAAGMSALSGLEVLVTALNPKAASDMQLTLMQAYCQTFLVGFRLAPVILGALPLIPEEQTLEIARGLIVCVSSLLCTVAARRAFPADKRHYPELTVGQNTSKPVLDQVRFCPFCGADDLELEGEKSPGIESATCLRCCAHNVPLRLVVRRSGATSGIAGEAGAGAWDTAAANSR